MSDADLVAAFTVGAEDALAEVYRRHQPAMHRLAGRLCGPTDAEDVTQDILVALWLAPAAFDPRRGSLQNYLMTRTQGRGIDVWRSGAARKAREVTDANTPKEGYDVELEALARFERDEVVRRLWDLSPDERQGIALAYFGGYTYRQVADLLERPEGTVKSCIRTGLRRLRAALGQGPGTADQPRIDAPGVDAEGVDAAGVDATGVDPAQNCPAALRPAPIHPTP